MSGEFNKLHEALSDLIPDPLIRIIDGYRTKEIDISLSQRVIFSIQNIFQTTPVLDQFLAAFDKGESIRAALIAEELHLSHLKDLVLRRADTLNFLAARAKLGKKWSLTTGWTFGTG